MNCHFLFTFNSIPMFFLLFACLLTSLYLSACLSVRLPVHIPVIMSSYSPFCQCFSPVSPSLFSWPHCGCAHVSTAGSPGRLAAGKDPVKFEEDRDRLYSLMLSIGNTIGALEEFTRTAATEVEEEGDDKKEEGHEAGSRKPSTLTEDDLLRICETFGLCDDEKEVEAAS